MAPTATSKSGPAKPRPVPAPSLGKPLQMADPPVDPALCVRCKGGRALCGKPCYLMADIRNRMPQVELKTLDWHGPSPPGMFVGRHGYPDVRVGPLVPPAEMAHAEVARLADTTAWYGRGIEELVAERSSLVHGKRTTSIHSAKDPGHVLRTSQELAMADRPADTELRFMRIPTRHLTPTLGEAVPPMGPAVETRRAAVTENPHVPRAVDRLVADTDALAVTGVTELAHAGIGTDHLTRLFSMGLLGTEERRRLVPTRWAITATDDILGKHHIERVKDLPELQEIHVHEDYYNGNHFQIILLPRVWGFDMQETWHAGSMWAPQTVTAHDWEEYGGRTSYAHNITGAYYAARLAALEHLRHTLRRQATVVVIRSIDDSYWAPLGVWLIRESARRALDKRPLVFGELPALVKHLDRTCRVKDWRQHSRFLGHAFQATLADFRAAGAQTLTP